MWPETRSAHNARKEMNVLDTHITVAIDGPSGAGKSTIARAAARRFGLIYVDTGAIYRTVGLAGERAGIRLRGHHRRAGAAAGAEDRAGL